MTRTTKPPRRPPYLPFMTGTPTTAPGLMPITERSWLTSDTETEHISEKIALMNAKRSAVYACQPGAEAACREAAHLIDLHMGTAIARPTFETPLETAAAELSDDLCLMQPGEDGAWHLAAASLCAPTFWSLATKIGQPLLGLHAPVPGAEDLASRITRIFTGLQPGQILERFNWTVQAGPGRYTPDAAPLKALAAETPDARALDVLHLRVERQTIRKLPETGAVLFTIRICIDPLRAAIGAKTPRAAFVKAWRGANPALAAYKGWPAYDRLVTAALTMLEQEQS